MLLSCKGLPETPTHYDLLDFNQMWIKKNSGRLTNKAWGKRSDSDLYLGRYVKPVHKAYYLRILFV